MGNQDFDKVLYIVRHGQTDFNKRGIIQGRGVNSDLNTQGRKQALAFYKAFQQERFDSIYVSALKRTYQSLVHFEANNYQLKIKPELDEIDWGNHEGKHPSIRMKREYTALTQAWQQGETGRRVEGGESPEQVQLRLSQFLEFLKSTPDRKILIGSHGRTIRILLCTLLNEPLSRMDEFPHRNLNLYKLAWKNEKAELLLRNNVEHLKSVS